MLGLIGSVIGGLGSLFGGSSNRQSQTQVEDFSRTSNIDTEAEAQDLSPELLAALESLFLSTLGQGGFERSGDALAGRLDQLVGMSEQPRFDAESFASDIVGQATAGARLDLESQVNQLLSQVGGAEAGSTMAALTANRLRNQTAANLGGIGAEARATGEGIRLSQDQMLTEGIQGLSGALSGQILNLIQATRGATQTGRSTSREETRGRSNIQMDGTSRGGSNPLGAIGSIFGAFNDARRNA